MYEVIDLLQLCVGLVIYFIMDYLWATDRYSGMVSLCSIRSRVFESNSESLRIKSINSEKHNLSDQELINGCRLGIDTHADTSCAGRHVRVVEYIGGKRYSVAPFHGSYEPKTDIGMINGVAAIDNPDGGGYIVELNNFLDFTDSMDDSILVPMQARCNGFVVNDTPKNMCYYGVSTQSIFRPGEEAEIPIEFNGPIPFIRIRYPSDDDLENFKWIDLTSSSEWKPYSEFSAVSGIYYEETLTQGLNYDAEYAEKIYETIHDCIIISGVNSVKKDKSVSPEMLARMWHITLPIAKNTICVTTNNYTRTNQGKLSRRFRTDIYQKHYRRLGGPFSRFYTDTLFFKVKSVNSFTCAQIFTNKAGYTKIYPLNSKSKCHEALTTFVHDVGIPSEIHSDDAREFKYGEFKKKLNKYGIFHTMSEPYSPWQNYAEDSIRIIKKWARYFMQLTDTPLRLIDHALLYVSELRTLTSSTSIGAKARTPFEIVHGNSPDISEYTLFAWYDYVWYWDPEEVQRQKLGRWLGVAEHVGNGLTYKVINANAEIIVRSTVTKVTQNELENHNLIEQMKSLDKSIVEKIGDYQKAIIRGNELDLEVPYNNLFAQDDNELVHDESTINFLQPLNIPDADDNSYHDQLSEELNDRYIGTRVLLPQYGNVVEALVKSRKRTNDGKQLIGKGDSNPLLDSRIYEVVFPDGGTGEFSANVIAESIYSNIDDEGHQYTFLDGIIGHRKLSNAVREEDGYYEQNGVRKRIVTTKGWELRVKWKDGNTSWIPLKELKSCNPIEVAEYATANNLGKEPAFAWWIGTVLKTRKRVISKIKSSSKVRKNTKFGVQIPMSMEEAKLLDMENKNSLWEDATKKELDKVRVAFQLYGDDEKVRVGSKLINYHIIYDVKFDLTRKARLVAGGHLNRNVPKHTTYSSVVSKESVRIAFTLAALNDLDVLAGDIGNAYLNAKPRELCHVIVRDEWLFGPNAVGKTAQIVRALYGMKSSGAAWRDMLASVLKFEMKFNMCYADNDIWLKEDVKPSGCQYYTYICIYVDDILICSSDPKKYMEQLKTKFLVKPESIKEPDIYLGADWKKKVDEKGNHLWITGANSYLKEALRVVNGILSKNDLKVNGSAKIPYSNQSYRAELDLTSFCTEHQHQTFQQLIGILRWLVELGRVDIQLEVTQLSSYLAAPRLGHLHQAFHIFKYLERHKNSWIPMDPEKCDIYWNGDPENSPEARRKMMLKIYQDATEEEPSNAPTPLGKSVQVNCYVDADHAGNKITRRSQTGILIYLNMSLISWFSKKQNTIEASTFGSEYIATRIAVEKIKALRYKLKMLGVPLDGPANIFADNESVIKASVNPESTLNKKHVSIAYHLTRESFAAGIVNIFFIPSRENLADLLTKVLPFGTRQELFKSIFW